MNPTCPLTVLDSVVPGNVHNRMIPPVRDVGPLSLGMPPICTLDRQPPGSRRHRLRYPFLDLVAQVEVGHKRVSKLFNVIFKNIGTLIYG